VRSWRVFDLDYAIAQILVPGARFEYKVNDRWSVNGAVDFTRGEGFSNYNNAQSGFFVTYMKPLHRSINEATGSLPVEYPLSFSIGMQQQTFFDYVGPSKTSTFSPTIRISLF
jgi:hypothetical protein